MIIFSTESKEEPNVGVAGIDLNYIIHQKESDFEMDLEAVAQGTQVSSVPSGIIDQILGMLGGSFDEEVLSQIEAYLLIFMANSIGHIDKNPLVIGFYEEELWANKRFNIVGNAPPGRRIYLSYYDKDADFTDDYILSTYSNVLGGFSFPTIALPKGGKAVIWMGLAPNDSIGNLKGYFKYWINYETKDNISQYYINYLPRVFEESHRCYSNITMSLNWSPESYYENNAFLYCIPMGATPKEANTLLEPTSQENCLNNILYAYQKQQNGQVLSKRELQIMTKTFSAFASDFNTKKDLATFKREESYEGILAWTYFYDFAPNASIGLGIDNSIGYLNTVVKVDKADYTHDNDQCDIIATRSWTDNETEAEMKVLSIDIDESEFDTYTYLVNPNGIESKEERELTCIRNLYLVAKKQANNETLSSTEAEILKISAQAAPFDFTISKSSQRISQRKSFKMSIAWASFYNKTPTTRDITIQVQSVTGELKMTGYYIDYISLNRPRNVSANANWDSQNYINNKSYAYATISTPSTNASFIAPTSTEECLGNIMLADAMQRAGTTLTDSQLSLLEQSFDGVPGTELPISAATIPSLSESSTFLVAWSGFYNNSHPQNPSPSFYMTHETVCLSGDTLITMADGSQKRLDEIKAGDEVLDQEGITIVESLKIMPANSYYHIYHFEDGIDIKETSPHRFYNVEQGFSQKLGSWEIGEHAVHSDGRHIALLSKERIVGEELKYGLYTKTGFYYANGLLSGPMFVNQPVLAEASIEQAVNMITSIDTARALKFAKTGDY